MTNEVPDEALVERYRRDPAGREGQRAARELFERYRRRVFLWCVRRVREEEKALDLAQDVLISAYRALGSFRAESRYSTWLYTIARNRCFRALRRPSLVADDEQDPDRLADEDADPASTLERDEDEERILRLVREHLEPDEQEALWLRCFERLPIDEVTRRLGAGGASGARAVLQRARRKLRAALERGAQGKGGRT